MSTSGQITQLLAEWSGGDPAALDRLVPLLYGELRRIASRHLRREQCGHTLQTTGLVHEAFLRLVGQKSVHWQNRSHFFSLASKMMRRVLIDQARARLAGKRGEGRANVDLDDLEAVMDGAGEVVLGGIQIAAHGQAQHADLQEIDAALSRLEDLDPRQAQIVELRFFGGLTVEETAQTLQISSATVKRDWLMAKGWLARELSAKAAA